MNRVETYTPNQEVESVDLNAIQDRALGSLKADSNNDLSALPAGMDGREWQYTTDLANATQIKVDASIDWMDRVVVAFYRGYGTSNVRPGQSNDYLYDGATLITAKGYTGKGAKDAGAVNAPTAGNPPVPAPGTSWAVQIVTNLWLYANPSDGTLWLYNATGSTIKEPNLTVLATAKTGKRP